MATNWKIGRVGSVDPTGKWESLSSSPSDYWENLSSSYWSTDVVWTFTGKAVTRDSD